MRLTFIFLLILFSYHSYASDTGFTCAKPNDDSTWWIPVEKFAKDEAKSALKELEQLLIKGSAGRDFIEVENYFTMIRGYMYQDFLQSYKAEFKKDDKSLQEEFCSFLQTQAYYQH